MVNIVIILLCKNNVFTIFVLLLTVTCAFFSLNVVIVHAHTPIIEDLTASRSGSTVTLTLKINHEFSRMKDEARSSASGMNVYSSLNVVGSIDVEVDGVVESMNTSRRWINWEENRIYVDPDSIVKIRSPAEIVYTLDYQLHDVTDDTEIRVRAVGYTFPENEYQNSEWTDVQTVAELLPAESTSPCLIATATYGSELTPQVQFLRTFRDDRVLQTFAGSQFMHVFNSFYYSWSPNVADTIRAHDSVATVMKPVLYPLIGILQISEELFSVLSFHPELAVVATGCVASALIAGIYLLPLTLLISYFRKQAVPRVRVSAMGIIWLASLSAIVLAELTQSAALMMTATGSFVLATMGATVLSMMNVLPAFLKKRLQS